MSHSNVATVMAGFLKEVNVLIQEEEEGIADVDLFTLTVDKDKLSVNSKWLQHLQVSPALTLLLHRPFSCAFAC